MTTKKQLRAEIEQQAQIISAKSDHIEYLQKTLSETVEARNLASENERQSYQWYQDAASRAQFLEKCLSKLRYVIALDVIQDGTHRSRNEYWRKWQQTILIWLSTDKDEFAGMDDIPF